jgi:rhodanese-related sulfurtransferase
MSSTTSIKRLLFRSSAVAVVSAGIAFAVNAGRPDSLPLVAESDYEIYEDCPEGEDEATRVPLDEVTENPSYWLFVDARPPEEFAAGHIEGALSLPYDPLFSVSAEDVEKIRAAAGSRTILVVGEPTTARFLANDLTAQGLDWVNCLEEGADWHALLSSGAR